MVCSACGLVREPADLIAFWPVGRRDLVRFVCRPSSPSPVASESCFRALVGPATRHAIAEATVVLTELEVAGWQASLEGSPA